MRDGRPAGDATSLPGWRTVRVVLAHDEESGDAVPVVVGLRETAAGGVQVAMRIGDDRPVILPLQDANQLALNVHETTVEQLKITAGVLGGDDQDRGNRS